MLIPNWLSRLNNRPKTHRRQDRGRCKSPFARGFSRQVSKCAGVAVEHLEERILLAGVTVITHGFRLLDVSFAQWTVEMAEAVLDRADGDSMTRSTGSLLVHDVDTGEWRQAGDGNPATTDWSNSYATSDEVVVVFDWTAESNDPEHGWLESAADNLFASLLQTNSNLPGAFSNTSLADIADDDEGSFNLHFIGHSRGAVVNTLVVQRFAEFFPDMNIDHVTTLDPHPADLIGNDPFLRSAYPTFTNVNFADNYYRTDPSGFYEEITGDFSGVEVAGAENTRLNRVRSGQCLDSRGVSLIGESVGCVT